jgi:hypothetical protein
MALQTFLWTVPLLSIHFILRNVSQMLANASPAETVLIVE